MKYILVIKILKLKINKVFINNEIQWKEKIYGQLSVYKRKAPYYAHVMEIIQDILDKHWENLSSSINKKFIETPKLRKYLEDKNYQIEKKFSRNNIVRLNYYHLFCIQ